MKKIIAVLVSLVLLALIPISLAEETSNTPRMATLTATGSAAIILTPDYATVSLGVATQADTVTAAQEQNAAQMNALLAALEKAGVATEDVQTNYFSISPVYSYSSMSGGNETPTGYRVDNTLLVTMRDLDGISQMLDAAMQAGANQSYGLTFESTQKGEAYDRALQEAAKEASRKAGLLAQASGKELGALMSIAEQNTGYRGEYAAASKLDSVAGTTILSGTLTVEATVEVTYWIP